MVINYKLIMYLFIAFNVFNEFFHCGVNFFCIGLNLIGGKDESEASRVPQFNGVTEGSVVSVVEHDVMRPIVGSARRRVEDVCTLSHCVALSMHFLNSVLHFLSYCIHLGLVWRLRGVVVGVGIENILPVGMEGDERLERLVLDKRSDVIPLCLRLLLRKDRVAPESVRARGTTGSGTAPVCIVVSIQINAYTISCCNGLQKDDNNHVQS